MSALAQQRGFWFLVLVLGLLGLSVAINWMVPANLGLDVAGGIRMTIRADLNTLTPEQKKNWPQLSQILIRILEQRAQKALGVLESSVYQKGEDRFVVELPGFTSEQAARDVISTSARLEYYWARTVATDRAPNRAYVHEMVRNADGSEEHKFRRATAPPGEFLEPGTPEYERMLRSWQMITTGDTLVSARPGISPGGDSYNLFLTFNQEGARALDDLARRTMNQRENIAAVLDGKVISFAYLKDGVRFTDGQVVLEGNFTSAEANRLAELLNAGALPVDLREENINRVNPTIGTGALNQIIFAGWVSFIVIAAFLLVYYLFPGLTALIALLCYISFSYAAFKLLGVTFSLAAIAGFILSIGMAVDANILIFERLKEELRNKRTLLTAIDLGFRRAFPAILDSNACTIITTIVLMNIGTGPVRGFATTLMIGVLISLFTAITVTRSLLLFFVQSGIGRNENWYGLNRGWFGERLEASADERPLAVVQKMGRYFVISGLIILPGIIFMALGGIRPNVEFLGGIEAGVVLQPGVPATSAAVNQRLQAAGIEGANSKIAAGPNGESIAYITVPIEGKNQEIAQLVSDTKADGTKKTVEEANRDLFTARQKIVEAAGGDPTLVTEKAEDGTERIVGIKGEESFSSTGPAVRAETIRGAILGVTISSLLIVIYLAMRFGFALGGFKIGLRFGFSAIGALVHDVLVVLGLAAITGYFLNWEISQLSITAILTVIGFSVHDTIVIFDRIRENLRRPLPGESFDNLVNRSITQSIARSINTSAIVVVTLAILVFVGSATPDLKHFNAAMLVGIVSGTYSSIFNAAPILVLWERIVAKRHGVRATIMHDERLRGGGEERAGKDDTGDSGEEEKYSPVRRRR